MKIFGKYCCILYFFLSLPRSWRDAGVAELARLESGYTSKGYQGFESPSLRKIRRVSLKKLALYRMGTGRTGLALPSCPPILLERCQSGRMGRTRNPLYGIAVSRVRIPVSPPGIRSQEEKLEMNFRLFLLLVVRLYGGARAIHRRFANNGDARGLLVNRL